ncbi:lipase maturation factor family protein [Acidicapsa dinghuensis]|uniref:Lipase maturation factor family protein n=1 Tax=Acidicapsa dinghuensis TaxID=2218256 RepID=A0ABW1ELQ2_9BACT|nr:lipase maturation factor family protein [Acidicapsa dinghuensis]
MESDEGAKPLLSWLEPLEDGSQRPNRVRWLFDSQCGLSGHLLPRWIFLRALGAIYFSAFLSLLFQIKGLIGSRGVLPAHDYLAALSRIAHGVMRLWYAPSLFWISSGDGMLMWVTWIGIIASLLVLLNIWPRLNLAICFVCFLSFVCVAQDFSSYQSDGMLLEAGLLALFLAPRGLRPGLGASSPPMRAAYLLLVWEWFRIYFESGMVKWLSGDPEWRHFTAMDDYYQNLPLPSWIGWYVSHLPHWFHVATAVSTLVMEFLLVLMVFFPRRVRIICFFIVTPWQIGVIVTANYAFLNYLVLCLGFLLLDDRFLRSLLPSKLFLQNAMNASVQDRNRIVRIMRDAGIVVSAVVMCWIGYATATEMIGMVVPSSPLPQWPVRVLEPFRIANQYGLFAVMTRGRYEIEFQGSDDGEHWTAYPFRFKPQSINEAPGIYAPYQPRFEWNLWFASLGDWQQNQWVALTEERLLENDDSVLALFRSNPFAQHPPKYVQAVLWQYWFTSMQQKRNTGNWWRRDSLGRYAPMLTRDSEGKFSVAQPADDLPPHD